jgi:hypothetical protein
VFDAYGEGDRPVLLGSKVTTGWIAHSGTIHRREISHTPGGRARASSSRTEHPSRSGAGIPAPKAPSARTRACSPTIRRI